MLETCFAQFKPIVEILAVELDTAVSPHARNSLLRDEMFNNPGFTIPGNTTAEQYQMLVNAVLGLDKGRKQGLYMNLGGK